MYYTQLRSDSNSAQYDNGEWGRGKSEIYYIHSSKDNAWGKNILICLMYMFIIVEMMKWKIKMQNQAKLL